MLQHVEPTAKESPVFPQSRKANLGQFMTPSSVARFMASLFPATPSETCRLLDAGAGEGSLSCAFLDRWKAGGFGFKTVEAFAYEIDEVLRERLAARLAEYTGTHPQIISGDFIELTTSLATEAPSGNYTHVILNPPYKKIGSHSMHRRALRAAGIETVNLYSGFVALALAMAAPGGQIVAIIPRSFCNGPYYRPFRGFLLQRAAIRHIHLFESRSKAFKHDDVLQENIIIRLERGAAQGTVVVSTSTDDTFSDLATHEYPFSRIVFPKDTERFIHVPTSPGESAFELSSAVRYSLEDLGLKVSTGPVVDFRLKAHLSTAPMAGTVPLLYPAHFSGSRTEWPKDNIDKPNAIRRNEVTEKWLYPNGHYCVVRRFSSKEEKRRIVASVVDPTAFEGAQVLGFENHLNLFHEHKHGLPKALAHGLTAFLNTTAVDDHFRRFSGHTQVNATDLKLMKYPSRAALIQLGNWAMECANIDQATIDSKFETLAA